MQRLHELIATQAEDATAFIDHDASRVRFGALRAQLTELCDAFRAHGIRPGDRVVLLAENCALFSVVVFALSRLDAWATLVNARQSEEEVAATVAHSGARCVVFTSHVSEAAQAHAERFGATEICALPVGPVVVSEAVETHVEPVDPSDHQVAALMYTTGTTSAPKGVMLTHRNLITNTLGVIGVWEAQADDQVLCALPMTHVFGFASFPAVPQMMSALFAHLDAVGQPLEAPAIRRISTGGAPLDPDLKQRAEALFGVSMSNGYGITEAAPTVSTGRVERPRADNSVGWPLDGIELRIDQPNEEGIGEIWIRGDNGALFIVGRLKELIIRSGFNVYPPEVEDMLTRHEAVYQAAVVGRPIKGNEEIIAFVLTNGAVDGPTLQAWLRERLVAYKVPQQVIVVTQYPTAATGKILKHKLLATFADHLKPASSETG